MGVVLINLVVTIALCAFAFAILQKLLKALGVFPQNWGDSRWHHYIDTLLLLFFIFIVVILFWTLFP